MSFRTIIFFSFYLNHVSRPSLAKYHTQQLSLSGDGTGTWTLTKVGTAEERVGFEREIKMLRERLGEVEGWESRLKELNRLLGPNAAEVEVKN